MSQVILEQWFATLKVFRSSEGRQKLVIETMNELLVVVFTTTQEGLYTSRGGVVFVLRLRNDTKVRQKKGQVKFRRGFERLRSLRDREWQGKTKSARFSEEVEREKRGRKDFYGFMSL